MDSLPSGEAMKINLTKEMAEAAAKRFWRKVDRSGDCWLWLGGKYSDGYGQMSFRLDGRAVGIGTHRVSYVLHNGPIPPGMCVMHKCDTPGCVNPAHLSLGTHAENMHDMIRKGRRASTAGQSHGKAKLTDDDVRTIRRLAEKGHLQQKEIGWLFGIKQAQVSKIKLRKMWAHVQ